MPSKLWKRTLNEDQGRNKVLPGKGSGEGEEWEVSLIKYDNLGSGTHTW